MRGNEPLHLKGKRALLLWAGWLLGPGAWALHESAAYALVPSACETGVTWPIHALTAVSIVIAIMGITLSYYLLRRTRPLSPHEDNDVLRRSRMQLLVGIGLSVAAFFGIALGSLGIVLLDYCTGA